MVQPYPTLGKTRLTIAPGKTGTRKTQIKKTIISNELWERNWFQKIVFKGTTPVLIKFGNSIKITIKKPRGIESQETFKGEPEGFLVRVYLTVVDCREDLGFHTRGDYKMEYRPWCRHWGSSPNGSFPEDEYASRQSIGRDSHPVPAASKFSIEMANSIKRSLRFYQTKNIRFQAFNFIKDAGSCASVWEAPIVPRKNLKMCV